MSEKYGKLRKEHIATMKTLVNIFHENKLRAGLHGTSLWNSRYKDVDLPVTSRSNNVKQFLKAVEQLKKKFGAKVIEQRGNIKSGLDYDIEVGDMVLHLSYVVLL